ncbi:MAG: PAS domain S-box protein [Gemmatimonadaceae bacterium]|nr:PAS domain S-box protein [Gemmatimonadaceae bacterium]
MPTEPSRPPTAGTAPRHSTPALGLQWLLFETAPHGMVIYDAAGTVVDANASAERLIGQPLAAMKGTLGFAPHWTVLRDDGSALPADQRPVAAALTSGAPVDGVVIGIQRAPAQPPTWLTVSAIPLLRPNSPRPYAIIAMFIDVTEQRKAVAELQASEERFRMAFRDSPQMMAISDLETGRFVDVNERYCEVTEFPRAMLLGQRSIDLGIIDAATRAALLTAMEQQGRVRNYEVPIRDRNGAEKTVMMSGGVLTLNGTRCLLTIASDITARRRLDAERERLSSHLRHLRRLENVGRLASGMAHDLNNGLTAVLALAELELQDAPAGTERHENLQYIVDSCLRAEGTLRQLIDLSRPPQEGTRDTVDLNTMLRDEVTLLARTTLQKVQLRTDLDPALPRVHGDAEVLRHAIMTVCLNAVDVMPLGGTLIVRTRRDGPTIAVVEITDVRTGDDPDAAAEPWAFTAMPNEMSEAFGLTMVREVIEAQGGTFALESALGKGGRVVIRLQAVAASAGF